MYVCLDTVKIVKGKVCLFAVKTQPKEAYVYEYAHNLHNIVINGVSITFLLGYFIYFSMRYIAYSFPMLKQICTLTKLC